MNLRKMLFWKQPAAAADEPSTTVTNVPKDTASNVVALPPCTPLDAPAGLDAQLTDGLSLPATAPQVRGLLDAPELKAFFAENYLGLGRHSGSNYRTQDALELGKRGVVSKFQNVLAELVERRQARSDRLQDKLLETEGFCDITSGRLRQALANLEREIGALRAQIDSASEGKGWVLEALNRYQIGFGKGLREAIEFELLLG